MEDYLEELDADQQEILTAVLTAPTRQEAADTLAISRTTLWRRLRDPELAAILKEIHDDSRKAANTRLMHAAESVVGVLYELASDPRVPAYSRVSACRAILDYAYKSYEDEEIDARIRELEELIGDGVRR